MNSCSCLQAVLARPGAMRLQPLAKRSSAARPAATAARRAAGMQYRRYCRRPIASPEALPTEHDAMDLGQPEEVLLDEDALAGALR